MTHNSLLTHYQLVIHLIQYPINLQNHSHLFLLYINYPNKNHINTNNDKSNL
uniref:Uncharacterized protein n=1 Tax=Tetranychus urticae TaxID=32264 RepID=T1KLD0_TETUR